MCYEYNKNYLHDYYVVDKVGTFRKQIELILLGFLQYCCKAISRKVVKMKSNRIGRWGLVNQTF